VFRAGTTESSKAKQLQIIKLGFKTSYCTNIKPMKELKINNLFFLAADDTLNVPLYSLISGSNLIILQD